MALIEEVSRELGIERRQIPDEEILERLLHPLVNEGARIVEEGIAIRASDIDVVYVNGYGFPAYKGGPMYWARAGGAGAGGARPCAAWRRRTARAGVPRRCSSAWRPSGRGLGQLTRRAGPSCCVSDSRRRRGDGSSRRRRASHDEPRPASSFRQCPRALRNGRTGARLFEGLGDFHRAVSTSSALAQQYFDQGMRLAVGVQSRRVDPLLCRRGRRARSRRAPPATGAWRSPSDRTTTFRRWTERARTCRLGGAARGAAARRARFRGRAGADRGARGALSGAAAARTRATSTRSSPPTPPPCAAWPRASRTISTCRPCARKAR